MSNIFSAIGSGLAGAAVGFMTGGPAGAAIGGASGLIQGTTSNPSGLGNISSTTDPTLALQQGVDQAYEYNNFLLQTEELKHQTDMQIQSQQFDDVQDEKSEQMREMNTLRTVAMKQRESDDKIVKEFIKTAGGD